MAQAESIEIPDHVVDQESADDYLDTLITGSETAPPQPRAPGEEPAQPEPEEAPPQPRDELGRFAKADDDESAPATGEPAAQPGVEPAPAKPEPEPAAAAPAPEPTAAGTVEEPPVGVMTDEEWDALPSVTYRAEGQTWELPGSKVEPDGVFIPTAQMPHVVRLLQEGHAHRGSFRDVVASKDAELARVTAKLEAELAATQVIKDQLEALVTTEGALETWVEDQRKNHEILVARAEKARATRELEHSEAERKRLDSEATYRRQLPEMTEAVREAVTHWGTQAKLGPEVQNKLIEKFTHPDELELVYPKDDEGKRTDGRMRIHDFIVEMMHYAPVGGPETAAGPRTPPVSGPVPSEPKPAETARSSAPASAPPAAAAHATAQPAPAPPRRRRPVPASVGGTGGSNVETPPKDEEETLEIPKFESTEDADRWAFG